jgi:DNA polymerase IV
VGHSIAITRCASCGSDRVVTHAELAGLSIAHVDCDAFYASIEKRDNPSLRDQPLLIGHDGGRGVVTTACYIARRYGCRSAMPMFKALKLCPDAVTLPPDMAKYKQASTAIRELFGETTRLFEPVSIDEAYLDLSSKNIVFDQLPARALAWLALEAERRVGITISIGLSHNKFLAKLASGLEKPRGFAAIGNVEALDFLAPLPVTKIHGVGAATAARMEKEGWQTIGQLQAVSERELVAKYGIFGHRLCQFVRGDDTRPVKPSRVAKSISAETTFATDKFALPELTAALLPLCERVSRSLQNKGFASRTVTLKLKTKDFKIVTRRATFKHPSQQCQTIFAAAERLLKEQANGREWRLIGVGVSDLCPETSADPPTLFDTPLRMI